MINSIKREECKTHNIFYLRMLNNRDDTWGIYSEKGVLLYAWYLSKYKVIEEASKYITSWANSVLRVEE